MNKKDAGGRKYNLRKKSEAASSSRCELTPSGLPCSLHHRCKLEPRFDIDGRYDYGDFSEVSRPPGNRHFIPRKAKLKSAGGKSISLYEKWRLMQYRTNCVMKKFLDNHCVNASVLPPCVNYDLWKQPKWKAIYDKPLDEDPCPDCDVRFTADCDNIYIPKIAPASVLIPCRWHKRRHLDSIILIGLPQHITVAYIRETSDCFVIEYLDPAGPSGDKRGADEVKMWTYNFFDATCSKPVRFYQAAKGINFQSDKNDVMCQTWIWYWVYFRLIRKVNSDVLARHIYRLGSEKKSLEQIHRFNCWLADLYKLGFYTAESPSQTKIAVMHTPQKPERNSGMCSKHRNSNQNSCRTEDERYFDVCTTEDVVTSDDEEDEDDYIMEVLGVNPRQFDRNGKDNHQST